MVCSASCHLCSPAHLNPQQSYGFVIPPTATQLKPLYDAHAAICLLPPCCRPLSAASTCISACSCLVPPSLCLTMCLREARGRCCSLAAMRSATQPRTSWRRLCAADEQATGAAAAAVETGEDVIQLVVTGCTLLVSLFQRVFRRSAGSGICQLRHRCGHQIQPRN
jgi:hypothetical protein